MLPRHAFTRCAFANGYSQQTSQISSLLFPLEKKSKKVIYLIYRHLSKNSMNMLEFKFCIVDKKMGGIE